jgi:DNA invertase Pin-like site-specific DNA recombinase
MTSDTKTVRCAIYTRVSTDSGLDQEFNSLDAQYDAASAYIRSQAHARWSLLRARYDDGGFSGGSTDRPALQRLLADVKARRVNIIVVYKVDRLTRSLADFAKLVELFDAHGVSFVSVTQQFNTTTSMGRLTLNILLSFAQFEREVIGERIRDKFAASRKRGMWMGGFVPLGYRVENRKLVPVPADAKLVRRVFSRFASLRSGRDVAAELVAEGATSRGRPFTKSAVYKLLANRVYRGDAVHKGTAYKGEHEAIVSRELWDRVHAVLAENPRARANRSRARTPALLAGLIFGPDGQPLTPTHTRKKGKLYRYYRAPEDRGETALRRVPAGEVERAVVDQIRVLLRAPKLVARTTKAVKAKGLDLDQNAVRAALADLDPIWDELFPAEQARIVRLLVERVDVAPDGLTLRLRTEGLTTLVEDLRGQAA